MEDALIEQHGAEAVNVLEKHLRHLSRIGGALTFLIHPGQFHNPEYRATMGLYQAIIDICRRIGAVSQTSRALVDFVRG